MCKSTCTHAACSTPFKGTPQDKYVHQFAELCMLISELLPVFSYSTHVFVHEILLEMLFIA